MTNDDVNGENFSRSYAPRGNATVLAKATTQSVGARWYCGTAMRQMPVCY